MANINTIAKVYIGIIINSLIDIKADILVKLCAKVNINLLVDLDIAAKLKGNSLRH